MLFKSQIISKTWDTWLYHHQDTYYLYYLTSERAAGDGFGVATSADGVHWHDYGRVLAPSEQMVGYLGTGSVWPLAGASETQRFLCNYSEWRQEGDGPPVQRILFAESDDLIHWRKLGDGYAFEIDERLYRRVYPEARGPWEWPRWDGINVIPRTGGGYYGYWTATPRHALGFGLGESDDGLHWRALAPPEVEWGDPPEMIFCEVGGAHQFGQQVYLMAGDYAGTHCGMFTLVADDPAGPFCPATRNFALLRNQSKMHVYFSRFLDTPESVLVNHHMLAEGQFADEHFVSYFAPLKRAAVIDGALYLAWWEGNDQLKAREVDLSTADGQGLRFRADVGIVLEGTIGLPGSLFVGIGENAGTEIRVGTSGVTEIGPGTGDGGAFTCEERVDREMALGPCPRFRLLLYRTMLEFYLDDLLIQCYTMDQPTDGAVSCRNVTDLRLWQWK